MYITIKRMFSLCMLSSLIFVSCVERNTSEQMDEQPSITSPIIEADKTPQPKTVITEPPEKQTIDRGFTEGFDASYFSDIGKSMPNAAGNNINENMAIFNENKNNFYVVDTSNYLDLTQNLKLTFIYQVNENNTVTKLFFDRPIHTLQSVNGDVFSQRFLVHDFDGGYLLSNSHKKPRFFCHDFLAEAYFSSFIAETNMLWYTLQNDAGIYKYEFPKEGEEDSWVEDMKDSAELVAEGSDANFQVYDGALYYVSDDLLYEYKDGNKRAIYTIGDVDKFLIDEYLIYLDDGELYIELNNEVLLIDSHVVTFNKLGADIFYSTGTELIRYSLEHQSKEKLLTADSDEGITQISICRDRLFFQDGNVKMFALDNGQLQTVSALKEDSESYHQYFSYNQGYTAHIPKQVTAYLGDGSYGFRDALLLYYNEDEVNEMRFAVIIDNNYDEKDYEDRYSHFDDIKKLKTSRKRYDVEYATYDDGRIWVWRDNLWMEISADKDYEDEMMKQLRVFIDSLTIFDWE